MVLVMDVDCLAYEIQTALLYMHGLTISLQMVRSQNKIEDCICLLIYIQQDAILHSLFYLETALHASGGTSTHRQERKQLHLQHLVFVAPLLLSAAILEEVGLV